MASSFFSYFCIWGSTESFVRKGDRELIFLIYLSVNVITLSLNIINSLDEYVVWLETDLQNVSTAQVSLAQRSNTTVIPEPFLCDLLFLSGMDSTLTLGILKFHNYVPGHGFIQSL